MKQIYLNIILAVFVTAVVISGSNTTAFAESDTHDNGKDGASVCKAAPAVPATPAIPPTSTGLDVIKAIPATPATPAEPPKGGCALETPPEASRKVPSMVVPKTKSKIDADRMHLGSDGGGATPVYTPLPLPTIIKKKTSSPSSRGPLLRKDYKP